MRFIMIRAFAGAQADDPDPRSAPATVPEEALMVVPATLPNTDAQPRRLLVAAEGTAGQTIGVELWALEEPVTPLGGQGDPQAPGDRKFYRLTTAELVSTVGQLREYTANMPGPGKLYVRLTTAPAAASVLKVACG